MVKCLASPFSRSDSYAQVLLNSGLTNEVIKATGSEANIKRYVLSTGFARYNTVYFNLTPLKHPEKSSILLETHLDKRPYYTTSLPTDNKIEIFYQPLTLYPSPLHKGRGNGIS